MNLFWLGMLIPPALLGFLFAHIKRERTRWLSLAGLCPAPLLVIAVTYLLGLLGPTNWIVWWSAMVLLVVPMATWAVCASLGFAAGRWSVR